MRDKRSVDELSIDELERILLIRKREARMQRFRGDRRAAAAPIEQPSVVQTPLLPVPVQREVTPTYEEVDDGGEPQFEDDLYAGRPYAPYVDEGPGLWDNLTGKFLLLVEIGAIGGLMLLVYLAYTGLTTVNDNIEKTDAINATSEAALLQSQIRPTATPLISVSQVVLPGGHVWDEAGQHRFNMAEVPAPYRSTFQQQLESPRTQIAAVPEGGPIRVQIPAIDVDAGIRSGDDWISLQAGVGHHSFSGNPGEEGNMVLTAHNDIFGEIFRRTEELEPGDEVRVQSSNGQWYTYMVREKQVVDPSEVWVLDQSLGQDTPLATLITCYPYRVDSQRIVVFAELVDESS